MITVNRLGVTRLRSRRSARMGDGLVGHNSQQRHFVSWSIIHHLRGAIFESGLWKLPPVGELSALLSRCHVCITGHQPPSFGPNAPSKFSGWLFFRHPVSLGGGIPGGERAVLRLTPTNAGICFRYKLQAGPMAATIGNGEAWRRAGGRNHSYKIHFRGVKYIDIEGDAPRAALAFACRHHDRSRAIKNVMKAVRLAKLTSN